MKSMASFTFTLRYQCFEVARGNHPDLPGMLVLEYTRAADSARQAVMQAIAELREINPQGYLAGIGPDLIDFAGVARLFELNPGNMRALMAKYGRLFPAPQFVGESAFWHAADILGLIAAQGWRDISEAEMELAQFTRSMNRAIRTHAS
jgi:hypothetical protein